MKPLTLTIQGLNSFEERACIDFEELTGRGLFGIFGPTGSGKSSILDGMTLALYGEAARGTKNFINVNCQRCGVVFEFLGGAKGRERYRVSRSYRREKETGNARAAQARLERLGPDGETEILADQTRGVNEACAQVLGLSREDFLRTAVLPQGRFAEFLRMQGKERTEMLERIFGLERFGTLLEKRVRDFGQRADQRMQVLEGQRQVYQGVTRETLEEDEALLKEKVLQSRRTAEEVCRIQAYMEVWRPVLEAREELTRALEQSRALTEEEPAIQEARAQAERAGTAAELSELLESAQKAGKVWEESRREREALERQRDEAGRRTEEAREACAKARSQREEEKPSLDRELEKLNLAQARAKRLAELERRCKELEGEREQAERTEAALEEERKALAQKREALDSRAEEEAGRKAAAFHTQEEQEAIQKGWELEREEQTLAETAKKEAGALSGRETSQKEEKIREAALESRLKEKAAALQARRQELAECGQERERLEDLAQMQEALTQARYAVQTWTRQREALSQAQAQERGLAEELEDFRRREQAALSERDSARGALEKRRRRVQAAALARDLKEGEPCPVCGSLRHEPAAFEETRELERLDREEKALKKLEKAAEKASRERIAQETKLQQARERLQKEMELEEEASRAAAGKDLQALEAALEERVCREKELAQREQALQQAAELLGEERAALTLQLAKSEGERKNLEQAIQEGRQRLDAMEQRLEEIREEKGRLWRSWPRESYQESRQALRRDARAFEEADKRLQELNRHQAQAAREWEALASRQAQGRKDLERLRAEAAAIQDQTAGERETLRELTEDWRDLPGRIRRIRQRLEALEKALGESEEGLAAAEKRRGQILQDYDRAAARESQDRGSFEARDGIFRQKMDWHQVPDTDWIEKNRRTPEEIEGLLNRVTAHREQETVVRGTIARLREFLDDRWISREEWEKNTACLPKLQKTQETLGKEISVLESETARLRIRLQELEALDARLEQERHRRALGMELEKLFRGKAFVKYISLSYLRYITRDANRQLRDITAGSYELAIGENGDFLMVDYRNGGKIRPCATLSGGETFLVSLALALSLSRQIQMNSSASIELFFLDEGFGTLDSRFTDVVMDSLYRLRERGLNVGLITHVEAIKERIGSRLLIQPGDKGSRVSYEFL